LRAPASPNLSSLNRGLEPGEQIIVLKPTYVHFEPCRLQNLENPGMPETCHGIEYLWEVLSTDQGVLVAVPVPVLESFGRAPKPCEDCPNSLVATGKCTANGFCLGTLPLDKHCMNTIDTVPDVDIVIRLCTPQKKTAANLQGNVDFVVSYTVRHPGGEWWIAIWGAASAQPVGNVGWAGSRVDGVGYFLEDTGDSAGITGATDAAADMVHAVVASQGLASEFAHGIKEKGIK
jgi:hypothetical protein